MLYCLHLLKFGRDGLFSNQEIESQRTYRMSVKELSKGKLGKVTSLAGIPTLSLV